MKYFAGYSIIFCAASFAPVASHAQAIGVEEAAQMRAEIEALKAQIDILETRLDTAGATARAKSAPSVVLMDDKVTDAPAISFKGAPEIKGSGGWSFKPRGRLLYDAAYVGASDSIADDGLGFGNELRRARLGAQGSIPGGFGFRFEIDFASSDAEITDAFFSYAKGPLDVTIGQHNNFQGLEELTSSNDSSFIERAAFTDAFAFQRRVGLSAQYASGPFLAQGGVFTANVDDLLDDGNNAFGLDGRLVYAPKWGNTQLHFGGSVHYRDLGDSVSSVRYRQRPLVHTTDVRLLFTPLLAVDREFGWGLEAAAISGRFHAAAETYWQSAALSVLPNDPTFFGAAIEAGIYLTDDSRSYKEGKFGGVTVSSPVSDGGTGAIQFNMRYDRLDLNDAGIIGGTQDGYMASLIWTPVDYVRFLINYAHLMYEDAAIGTVGDRDYSVDVVGARAQISF